MIEHKSRTTYDRIKKITIIEKEKDNSLESATI